jgi:hypothetical protein
VPAGPKPAQAPVETLVLYDDAGHAVPPWEGLDFFAGEPLPEGGALRPGGAGRP